MVFAILMGLVSAAGFGQQFEAASIKPSNAGADSASGMKTGNGRLHAVNVTLKRCIVGAYGVGPGQVIGGPSWMDTERFEIIATTEQPVGDQVLMVMLRGLLAERFQLAIHRENRQLKGYVLRVAEKGLRLVKGDGGNYKSNRTRGSMVAANMSMDHLAEMLSRQLGVPVVNRTSVEGAFSFTLRWTPDSAGAGRPPEAGGFEGPSLFTALQEQLGLRLQGQRVPVDVVVVDRAERPSEN
ncbi:MAG: TIGR03435 family protein [Acidobacteria bacterium]|nr:TIGR03435 family protein [Acidobacteriota bacterium]